MLMVVSVSSGRNQVIAGTSVLGPLSHQRVLLQIRAINGTNLAESDL